MNPDLHDPRTFVSRKAAVGDPRHNRNYRCNPCIMVRHRVSEKDSSDPIEKNIVVDVGMWPRYVCVPVRYIFQCPTSSFQLFAPNMTGKTFREASVRWFPEHNVQTVDSILLTHGHADAIFGLDVRTFFLRILIFLYHTHTNIIPSSLHVSYLLGHSQCTKSQRRRAHCTYGCVLEFRMSSCC